MEMSPTPPPTLSIKPPPDPPESHSFDLSPLEFLVALFAIIIIPTLIYTFFLFLKCPSNLLRRQSPSSPPSSRAAEMTGVSTDNDAELARGVKKYKKEAHGKDVGSECPVCLSVFSDGEEVRQLSVCKHLFHVSCIDLWLHSHSNCPVCRASVAVKEKNGTAAVVGDADLRQGLPDSATLI